MGPESSTLPRCVQHILTSLGIFPFSVALNSYCMGLVIWAKEDRLDQLPIFSKLKAWNQ